MQATGQNISLGSYSGKKALKVTLDTVVRIVNEDAPQFKSFARRFDGGNAYSTAYNIWRFLRNDIQYAHDAPGKEEIRHAARLLKDRRGDCEDFSIFAATILKALGYNPVFYVVAFNGKPNYGHIYVVVNGTVLDGVMDRFNVHPEGITKFKVVTLDGKEKTFYKNPEQMEVVELAGIEDKYRQFTEDVAPFIIGWDKDGSPLFEAHIAPYIEQYLEYIEHPELSGLGDLGSVRDWFKRVTSSAKDTVKKATTAVTNYTNRVVTSAKDDLKKVVKASEKVNQTVKKYSFAAPRNAFLLLLRLNVFHLSSKLYIGYLTREQAQKINLDLAQWSKAVEVRKRFEKFWTAAGGSLDSLKKAIMEGRAKKWLAKQGIQLNGLGEPVTATAAATAVTTSAPFWKKLLDWFKEQGINWDKMFAKATDVAKNLYGRLTKNAPKTAEEAEQEAITITQTEPETQNSGNSKSSAFLLLGLLSSLFFI